MKAELECLPCLVRQAVEEVNISSPDSLLRRKIMRRCFAFMSETDLEKTPPEIAGGIARIISRMTGVEDPYKLIKSAHTKTALKMVPEMDSVISQSDDPFLTGLKLAISGNIIDLGARERVSDADIIRILDEAMSMPLRGVDPGRFKAEIERAGSILYLADNAGETVFDRKFIEQLPGKKITVAVRGAPAINDATLEDARDAGLDRVATLVENGSGIPATVLSDCSPEFREIFENADLIISKGQGNYESLSSSDAAIYFLFKVKCDLVAYHSGFPVGSQVLLKPSDSATDA